MRVLAVVHGLLSFSLFAIGSSQGDEVIMIEQRPDEMSVAGVRLAGRQWLLSFAIVPTLARQAATSASLATIPSSRESSADKGVVVVGVTRPRRIDLQ